MSKKIEKSICQRQTHRKIVFKYINEAKDIILSYDESLREKLLSIKLTVEKKKNLIENLDTDILNSIDGEVEMEKEVEDASEFETIVNELLLKIQVTIEKGSESLRSVSTSSSSRMHAKLPKLVIKPFDGNPLIWKPFQESFMAAVDANDDLSDVDKFNHLRNLVKGSAEKTIAGLSLCGNNYGEALKLLNERFGNKQVLINEHTTQLLRLSKVKDLKDISKVRLLHDSIECHIRNLKSLGVVTKNLGSMLVTILMEKIPDELRLIITRKFDTDSWCIEKVLEAFKAELLAREKCHFKSNDDGEQSHTATAAALHTVGKTLPFCVFCQQPHPSSKCTVVTEVAARKSCLRNKGKCFLCLKGGHIIRNCPSRFKCFKCGGRHNISICEPNPVRRDSGNRNFTNATQTFTPEISSQSTNFVSTHPRSQTLLQTAQAQISDVTETKTCRVRVLLDPGSQKTYITEKLASYLNLSGQGHENVILKTAFESELSEPRRLRKVNFCMKNDNHSLNIYLDAYAVPTICQPIVNQPFDWSKYPHLKGVKFSDECVGELGIDIFIGADFYWRLITGEVRRGEMMVRLRWVRDWGMF